FAAPTDVCIVLNTQRRGAIDDTQDAAPLVRLGEHDFGWIGSRTKNPADLGHQLDRVQYIDRGETLSHEHNESVPGGNSLRIAARQFLQIPVRTGPAYQALSRCLAECQAELDSRDARHQRLVNVLDTLDEVGLPQYEVDRIRLIDSYGKQLHAGCSTCASRSCSDRNAPTEVSATNLLRAGVRVNSSRAALGARSKHWRQWHVSLHVCVARSPDDAQVVVQLADTASQNEIDLRFAPLLRMADNVMMYKCFYKNAARRYGKVAADA